jgi:hypothetical protein
MAPKPLDPSLPRRNLQGQTFGRLSVIAWIKKKRKWLCLCSCGKFLRVAPGDLRPNRIASCGCYMLADARKSAKFRIWKVLYPRAYAEWMDLFHRTATPQAKKYSDPKWFADFEVFVKDIGGEIPPGKKIGRKIHGKKLGKDNFILIDEDQPRSPRSSQRDIDAVRAAFRASGLTVWQMVDVLRGLVHPNDVYPFFHGKKRLGPKPLTYMAAALGVVLQDPR